MADAYDEKYQSVHLLSVEERSGSSGSSLDLHDPIDIMDEKRQASPLKSRLGSLLHFRPRTVPQFKSSIQLLVRFILFLVPSFLISKITGKEERAARVRPTAFLDGLRGVASFAVFNTHLSAVLAKDMGSAWGHDENSYHFLRLPIVRLLYGGHAAVTIFFVISGFALSIGPVSKMNKAQFDHAATFRSFASSVFRRPFRLFVPAFVSTFIVFCLIRLDVFEAMVPMMPDPNVVPGWDWLVDYPKRMDSFWDQLHDLGQENIRILQVYTTYLGGSFSHRYNSVLWTIALEWRASLMLFITHAALYFVRRPWRIGLLSGLIVVSMMCASFEMPLFYSGYLLAETWTPPVLQSPELPIFSVAGFTQRSRKTSWRVFCWVLLFCSLYVASITTYEPWRTPAYSWLAPYTLFGYFWVYFWASLGCVLTTFCIGQLPSAMNFFSSAPIRYLGKISFSLYLVHITIVRGFGVLVFYVVWGTLGRDNASVTFLGFVIAYTFLFAFVVWVSDIFYRAVETPTVEYAKWLEGKLFRTD